MVSIAQPDNKDDEQILPAMRKELSIFKSTQQANGAPSWVIFDPIKNAYYEIGKETLNLLSVWSKVTIERLQIAHERRFGTSVSNERIQEIFGFLKNNGLVDEENKTSQDILERDPKKKGLFQKLIHSYLFFRIPLVRPDRFLSRTYAIVEPLYSKTAFWIFAVCGFFGLFMVSRQWEQFSGQFQDFLSYEGLVFYGIALMLIKTLHELGHAYTAKRYGLNVPTIGVAVILLMPVLYTDATDAWRLQSHKQRFYIGAAGMVVEFGVAILATLFWVFLPDSMIRSLAFSMATIGWISSVLVNCNPFMRFDGYYLFSDILGVNNLQTRGFALAQWHMREKLFKLNLAPPELVSPRMRSIMIGYAYGTWIYRVLLFVGIAVLVYAFFIKVIGIILFLFEIIFFIAKPIWKELKHWWSIRGDIMKTKRSWFTLMVVSCLLAASFIPWSGTVNAPAVVQYAKHNPIFPPVAGKLQSIYVREGQSVKKGDPLFLIISDELAHRAELGKVRLDLVKAQLSRVAANSEDRLLRPILLERQQLLTKEQVGLEKRRKELLIRASTDGIIVDFDSFMSKGIYVSPDQELALLRKKEANTDNVELLGYIEETDIEGIQAGLKGMFFPDLMEQKPFEVEIREVSDYAAENIEVGMLTDKHGGAVKVLPSNGSGKENVARKGQYAIYFKPVDGQDLSDYNQHVSRGMIRVDGPKKSFASRVAKQVAGVLLRETGF